MAEPPEKGPDRPRPPYLAVVRQGHDEVFEFLRHFQEANLTEVLWDRRLGDRRAAEGSTEPDRRVGERRGLSSPSWDALGFVLAPLAQDNPDATLVASPAAEATPEPEPPQGRPQDLCVVRRGHTEVFRLMQEHFRDDPSVQVIWDRRLGERRTNPRLETPDRRHAERRRP